MFSKLAGQTQVDMYFQIIKLPFILLRLINIDTHFTSKCQLFIASEEVNIPLFLFNSLVFSCQRNDCGEIAVFGFFNHAFIFK